MPQYPELETLPPDCLVPLDQQPEYLPLDGLTIPAEVNLCEEMVDVHVRDGLGQRPAIIFADEGRTLTFDEVLAEVERTAGALVGEGLRPGERVAVRAGNRPETTVAFLAVWRAGGIVVPTPPQARAGEIPFYLNDTGARFLLVGSGEPLVEVLAAASGPDEALRLGVERIFVLGPGADGPFVRYRGARRERRAPPPTRPAVVRHAGRHLAHRRHHRNTESLLSHRRPVHGRWPRRRPRLRFRS